MNESFSVRPRMNASGATSIVPRLHVGVETVGVEHVVERVEEGAEIRIDLREHVAGEEAEPLPRLDGGAGQDDPVDLAVGERGTASAIARYVFPVPAGPIPKVIVPRRIAST